MRAIFVVIAAVLHVVRADDALLHGSGRGWNVTSSRPRTLERGCLLGTESMGYALVLEPGDSASVELFGVPLVIAPDFCKPDSLWFSRPMIMISS